MAICVTAGRSAFVNTLENVREDPLTTTPGGGPHPASLSSASSTPSWPGDRVRSISLTGQHVSAGEEELCVAARSAELGNWNCSTLACLLAVLVVLSARLATAS